MRTRARRGDAGHAHPGCLRQRRGHAPEREPRTIKPGETALFDQTADLARPQLWWPNNSPYGKPHLYRVVSDVQAGGATVDSVESPLGVRMVTWDDDYCYVNGQKHLLNGYGHRNLYPALGSAVPADLQWKDVKLMADSGANLLRVGHVPAFVETVKACDAYGIMVLLNSGDNEWTLEGEPALTYKKEYDRDMIIRFRNHPSVVAWESNNWPGKQALTRRRKRWPSPTSGTSSSRASSAAATSPIIFRPTGRS